MVVLHFVNNSDHYYTVAIRSNNEYPILPFGTLTNNAVNTLFKYTDHGVPLIIMWNIILQNPISITHIIHIFNPNNPTDLLLFYLMPTFVFILSPIIFLVLFILTSPFDLFYPFLYLLSIYLLDHIPLPFFIDVGISKMVVQVLHILQIDFGQVINQFSFLEFIVLNHYHV